MVRALFWKEWREQRAVLAAGIGMALMLPAIIMAVARQADPGASVRDVVQMVPSAIAFFVWPLFATIAGVSAGGDSGGNGTLGFLLSRPVSKARLWVIKVSSAAVAVALIIAGSFAIARLVDGVVGGVGFPFPFGTNPFEAPLPLAAARKVALGLPVVGLASGIFFATIIRRPLPAALAGGMATLVATFLSVAWGAAISAQSSLADGAEGFLVGSFAVFASALAIGGLFLFRAGVMLPGAGKAPLVALTAIAVLVGGAIGILGVAVVTTHADASAALRQFSARPLTGSGAVMLISRPNGFVGPSIWIATTEAAPRRLTRRMAYAPSVSPDGEWLVYGSGLGRFGTRRDTCELRAVRVSGAQDHRIADAVPCGYPAVFSQDGSRVAIAGLPGLIIATVDATQEAKWLDTPTPSGNALAWVDDDTGIIWRADRAHGVALIDVDSGEASQLFADAAARLVYVPRFSRRRIVVDVLYPQRLVENGSRDTDRELLLVDVATGGTESLSALCAARAFTLDFVQEGEALVYSKCATDGSRSELWLRNLENGVERMLTEVPGAVDSVRSYDEGQRFLVQVDTGAPRASGHRFRSFVVEQNGARTEVDFSRIEAETGPGGAWRITSFLDAHHVLLARRVARNHYEYVRFDLRSGDVSPFPVSP